MTDLETMQAMFARSEIEFKESDDVALHGERVTGGKELTVVGGYVGFISTMTFDAAGKLLALQAWEC
jgi:hypothetical protein